MTPNFSTRRIALTTLLIGAAGFGAAAQAAEIKIGVAEALTGGAAQYEAESTRPQNDSLAETSSTN